MGGSLLGRLCHGHPTGMAPAASCATTTASAPGFMVYAVIDPFAYNGEENRRDDYSSNNGWDHTPTAFLLNVLLVFTGLRL